MLNTNFGIEIEFTGITRKQAAEKVAEYLGGRVQYLGTYYNTYGVVAPDGRVWKFMSDGSIRKQKKMNGRKIDADNNYSVELVSPILTYNNDIETLQEIIRQLRHIGAFANESCGIHIHCDGAEHTPRSIKNLIKIVYSKNDLLYKALQINPERLRYCKKMDTILVDKISRKNPKTMQAIEDIWYEGYSGTRDSHYHSSRYYFCNLHSFFHGHKTVEFRGFNSTLHAGIVRSYISLALALNHQAIIQKSASTKKPQSENEKFALRTFLVRIGLNGSEFANCREHLTKHLNGNAAWRFGN